MAAVVHAKCRHKSDQMDPNYGLAPVMEHFWTLSSWTQTFTSEIAKKYLIKDTKFGQKIPPAASSSGSIVVVQAFDQRHVGLNKSQVGCKRTKIFITGRSVFSSPGLTKDESPNIFLLHWFAYNIPYILSLAYFL